MTLNLLDVDWDYFFPTPLAGAPRGEHDELYAWPAAEDRSSWRPCGCGGCAGGGSPAAP
ncbi:hypothetical protein [Streptomyces fradiae]|uniref:hypothetical protein n=1 Tax=Streptomyces fradiae TaxID=1906 RepID=UPI0035BE4B53